MPADAEHSAEELMDIREAAALLKVSKLSLRRWTNDGKLPCLRMGEKRERRFRRGDLLAFAKGTVSTGSGNIAVGTRPNAGSCLYLEGIPISYGSHLGAFYRNDLGRLKLSVPFLLDGLRGGEVCYLVGTRLTRDQIVGEIAKSRSTVQKDIDEGRLVLHGGARNLSNFLDELEANFVKSMRTSSHGMRLLGDMTWAPEAGIAEDELAAFEAKYDKHVGHSYPVAALCQYDTRVFSGTAILSALKCHADTFNYPLSRFLF